MKPHGGGQAASWTLLTEAQVGAAPAMPAQLQAAPCDAAARALVQPGAAATAEAAGHGRAAQPPAPTLSRKQAPAAAMHMSQEDIDRKRHKRDPFAAKYVSLATSTFGEAPAQVGCLGAGPSCCDLCRKTGCRCPCQVDLQPDAGRTAVEAAATAVHVRVEVGRVGATWVLHSGHPGPPQRREATALCAPRSSSRR